VDCTCTSIISALAAVTGAAVGGLTSGTANWLNHRSEVRVQWILHKKTRRQTLYWDFIEEAAKCYIDALQHDEANIPGLVSLYAKLSSMRVPSLTRLPFFVEELVGMADRVPRADVRDRISGRDDRRQCPLGKA
jgi:hypothetical protein